MEEVAILDAGSQFGKVIDRRVRELGCFSRMYPLKTHYTKLQHCKCIIISGGPESVHSEGSSKCDPNIFTLGIPILGICYGMQLINYFYGGNVEKGLSRSDGQKPIKVDKTSRLFSGIEEDQKVLLTHGDRVTQINNNIRATSWSEDVIVALEHVKHSIYGVQFHPEVDLTLEGKAILRNFLIDISGMTGSFTLDDRVNTAINEIRRVTQNKEVVVLVSGGVDSTVCCGLLYKALGSKRVHGIHVDTGFMRKDESELVKTSLEKCGFYLDVVNAKEEFFKNLRGVVGPEKKRSIIGDTFMRVIDREIKRLGLKEDNYLLAQGTLRPDLIESANSNASDSASVIKTHHNDTGLVRKKRQKGLIIEPLKDYHKDEVRDIGRMVGLPEIMVDRQPFPGPGLAIRTLCALEPYVLDRYDETGDLLKKIYGGCLLPIRSVGVQGDGRSYSRVYALPYNNDWDSQFKLATEITSNYEGINRVICPVNRVDIRRGWSFTPTILDDHSISQVRSADFIAHSEIKVKGLSQMPVILIPVSFTENGKRSIVIRTFITNDFMTGVPARPEKDISTELLSRTALKILTNDQNISQVFYDLTAKPPGTTEWE